MIAYVSPFRYRPQLAHLYRDCPTLRDPHKVSVDRLTVLRCKRCQARMLHGWAHREDVE